MSLFANRWILSLGLMHIIACGEKDTGFTDLDNDGVIDSEDCDDQNSAISTSTDSVGDGIDPRLLDGIDGTDGDGDGIASVASRLVLIVMMLTPVRRTAAEQTFYADKDGDGFGDADNMASACEDATWIRREC